MPVFLDKPVKEEVELAIGKGDPKLVQILLGPKYCQLCSRSANQHWFSLISLNIINFIFNSINVIY
jgi:hypothetical protein